MISRPKRSSSFLTSTSTTERSGKRRRVTFSETSHSCNALHERPPLHFWVSSSEITASVRKQSATVQHQVSDCYLELLLLTYVNCQGRRRSQSSLQQAAKLALARGETRGLEAPALRSLARLRVQRRRSCIRHIVKLSQQKVAQADELASVSKEWSRTSLQFARVLGVSDALEAWMEHQNEREKRDEVIAVVKTTKELSSLELERVDRPVMTAVGRARRA